MSREPRHHAPSSSLVSRLGIAVAGLMGRVRVAIVAWNNRRAVWALLSFDDYLLRDIGVSRQDVESALAEPLFRDASWRLAERAVEQRRGDRARAEEARFWAAHEADQSIAVVTSLKPKRHPRAA